MSEEANSSIESNVTSYPADRIWGALTQALRDIDALDPDAVVRQTVGDMTRWIEVLTATALKPTSSEELCSPSGLASLPALAPPCLARELALSDVQFAYDEHAARIRQAFIDGHIAWQEAQLVYRHAMNNALLTINSFVAVQVAAYNAARGIDSRLHEQRLYGAMQVSTAEALRNYQLAAATAGAALAAASGIWLARYADCVRSLEVAQSEKLLGEATARLSFVQAAEALIETK